MLLFCAPVLRDEFREQPPESVEVVEGGHARLPCRPPRGEPEPGVRWSKDGEALGGAEGPTGLMFVDEEGSLMVLNARRGDAGVYVCVGFNIAGERQSNPTHLAVRGN